MRLESKKYRQFTADKAFSDYQTDAQLRAATELGDGCENQRI